ncbi:SGNH/GDSL hydrolase family protein [Streptomyces sp. NPDC004539]|uniref:SGNH/GDSL hydrolase family protein n=1 Tax=Streptomyces sp. NPDC004539 TaxID=3154280 RepID=UPI0033BD370E
MPKPQGRHARPSRRAAAVRRVVVMGGQAVSTVAMLGALAGTAHADGNGGTGTIKVTVIGDSYTSGEGASAGTYRTVTVTGADGDLVSVIDPAHQSASAPTLQALSRVQQQNPDVTFEITFVPVSGATRDSLYNVTRPGTEFEHSPQIDAVNGADIVIVGIGGNDAHFGDLAKTMLTSKEATTEADFASFMTPLQDGSYYNAQLAVYQDIANRMSPDGTMIALGYPKVMPDQVPSGSSSPVSELLISSREAQLANQFGTAISNLNQQAVESLAQSTGRNFLYGDVTNSLAGHELFTQQEGLNGLDFLNLQGSYHPNDLGQTLISNTLTPTVNQAVIYALGNLGLVGPPAPAPLPLPTVDTPPVTDPPADAPPAEQPPPADPGDPGGPVADPPPADPVPDPTPEMCG